jgi:RNA polymerase sigma-70 factor, ECF subfamily
MDSIRMMDVALERGAPAQSDEAALIAELQAGSEGAFAYLVAVYQNPVYGLISHLVANQGEAADVLQNVFLKVLRGIRSFNGKSSLKTWIYRIAVHEASNCRRSWVRRLFHEPFSVDDELMGPRMQAVMAANGNGSETPDTAYMQAERQAEVRKALDSLAQPYRSVAVLREIEDLSYEEIAQILGVPEGTVKSRLRRGRELLKQKLARRLGR